ncbi:MAG: secretin N-terminal domain-containing protein [Solirubrobacterales bacterium]
MMKKRMLMVAIAAILAIPGILLSQDAVQVQDQADAKVMIVNLKYYSASEMSNILQALSQDEEMRIIVDENANRLILRAPERQMSQLVALIEQLDVPTESAPQTQSLLCRVYMVELPAKPSDLKPFTVVLQTPSPVPSTDLLRITQVIEGLRITRLLQGSEWTPDGTPRVLIRGMAASKDVVQELIGGIGESQLVDLRWDEETTGDTASMQTPPLPDQLYEHIRKFLGADVKTVGYWFGNFSSPGEGTAPIGPWSLQLKTRPAPAGGVSVEVHVTQNPQFTMDTSTTILSNSLQGKIGKPIIIGYNRESYGTRTMGAMVILLEADTSGPGGA